MTLLWIFDRKITLALARQVLSADGAIK